MRSAYGIMFFLFIAHIFTSFSSTPPLGRTGAPGETSCNNCHGSNNPQGLEGSLRILGLPDEVMPNTNYRVTVEVASTNGLSMRAGMQMTALNSNNTAAGTFSNPSPNGNISVANNGRNYLGHVFAEAYDANGIVTWETDWTSPAELDPRVTFYAACNISDMDPGSNSQNDLVMLQRQSTRIVDVAMELPDLTASNVMGFQGTFAPDEVVEFTWDLNNLGTAVAVEGYRIAMFLSDDNQFSADDAFVGEVPTGNTFPGTIPNVPGAIRIPLDAADGDYYLHFLVDADGVIEESDETNNLHTTNSTITVLTPVLDPVEVDISASISCQASAMLTALPSGGTMDYTYLWTFQETTQSITVVESGTYTVTVTDSDGISAESAITLEIPAVLDIGLNLIPPIGAEVIPMGGTAPFSYLWSDGTTTQTNPNLSEGFNSVTVTDANNCTASTDFVVEPLSDISLSATVRQLTCSNSLDASIEVEAMGGIGNYTYLWSTGETTSSIINLDAGPYSVTVSDGVSTDAVASFIITAIEPIDLVETITDARCNGEPSGAISVLAIGGTGPYQYSWNNGTTTNNNEGLLAGAHTVTVMDANGCLFVEEFMVGEPTALMVELTTNGQNCFGSEITLLASGGVPPYDAITNSEPGSNMINVILSDANGCSLIEDLEIPFPDPISVSSNIVNVTCFGEADGAIELTNVAGGTAPYTYAWDIGFTSSSVVGLTAGTYEVTITDANGCEIITLFEVSEPDELTLTSTIVDQGTGDGSIDIEVAGGTGAYTYLWSNGETTQDIFGLSTGDFTVVVTDANGCELVEDFSLISTSVATISELSEFNIYPTPTQDVLNIEVSFSGAVEISTQVFSLDGSYQELVNPDFSSRAGTQKSELDVRHLESGIYLLVLQSEEGVVVERFVKL